MTLSEFLAAYLLRVGVKEIFGLPGDLVLRLFSRLGERREWKMITFSHEPAVGFAADGYALATGTLGVACVTYGVGSFSLYNAIAGAFVERCPVVLVNGTANADKRDQFLRQGVLFAHADDFNQGTHLFAEAGPPSSPPPWASRWDHPSNDPLVQRIRRQAAERGITPAEMNLAWLLNRPFPVIALVSLPEFLTPRAHFYERTSCFKGEV